MGCKSSIKVQSVEEKPLTMEANAIEQKISSLINQMTIKEKAGQMLNIGLPAILTGGYWDVRDSAIFHKKTSKNL